MMWGEYQSVLQLATGLNVVYFSVPDLRTRHVEKIYSHVNAVRHRVNGVLEQFPEELQGEFNSLAATSRSLNGQFNHLMGLFYLTVSLIGVALLVVSSYQFSRPIPDAIVYLVLVIGLAPGFFLSLTNIIAAHKLKVRAEQASELPRKFELAIIDMVSRAMEADIATPRVTTASEPQPN